MTDKSGKKILSCVFDEIFDGEAGISMGLFGPIWESRNTEKIRRRIAGTGDQRLLSNIALYCRDPELRKLAAARISSYEIAASTLLEAGKKGDLETASVILRDGRWMFNTVVQSGDLKLLSILALNTKNMDEWTKEYDPLLSAPGFEAVSEHYRQIKAVADEKKRALARQKRKETEAKRHEELIRDPIKRLTEAAGKPSEKKLWKEWYEYQLSLPQNDRLCMIARSMQGLPWDRFFPAGALEKIALYSAKPYGSEDLFRTQEAEEDLSYLLQTLSDSREDLREEILRLDGSYFYSGKKASTVNFGDHHEDWLVTFDAVPAYRLCVSFQENRCDVHLEEAPWIPEKDCLESGGHIFDGRCACFRCGTIAHDWEVTRSKASVLKVCKRCGYRLGLQDYTD